MAHQYAAEQAIAEIDKLKESTPHDWDSYQAYSVGLGERERAKAFVRVIGHLLGPDFKEPLVSPVSDPGVALIWRSGAREVNAIFTQRGDRYAVIRYDGGPALVHGELLSEMEYRSFAKALRELVVE